MLVSVREVLNAKLVGLVLGVLVLGFAAEIAQPTFTTDYFYDFRMSRSPFYAFLMDGRYLSELIWHASWKMFPPTLLLLVGLCLLGLFGVILSVMLGVKHTAPIAAAVTTFVTVLGWVRK